MQFSKWGLVLRSIRRLEFRFPGGTGDCLQSDTLGRGPVGS